MDSAIKKKKGQNELGVVTKRPGNATHFPAPGCTCRVHYEARLENGDVFDSSPSAAVSSDVDRTVFERVAALRSESFDWRFNNRIIFERGPAEDSRAVVRQGYDDLQRATRDLDLSILAKVDASRRRMANEQRLQSRITLALALVALFATLIVGRVARGPCR